VATRRRAYPVALWLQAGPWSGLTYTEQAQIWRAVAKGHAANGNTADRDAALDQARMIERTRDTRFAEQGRKKR